jgi:ubiquitin-like 1-activating enzyme E1 B
MAGNIIPAIATTNAIIAGALVSESLKILRGDWKKSRMIWLASSSDRAITASPLAPPSPACAVCQTPYVPTAIDAARLKLGDFLEKAKAAVGYEGDAGLLHDARMLYDPDFEDNVDKMFADLRIKRGDFLTITDDDEKLSSVVFVLTGCVMISSRPLSGSDLHSKRRLDSSAPEPLQFGIIPKIPLRQVVVREESVPSVAGTKRKADEAEIDDGSGRAKKLREEDGVIFLDEEERPKTSEGVIELD